MSTKEKFIYRSPANEAFDKFIASGRRPLSWVIDKYAKNNAMPVATGKWDLEKKCINYEVVVKGDSFKNVTATYEDICKTLKWKSFEIFEDKSVIPVELTMEEEREMLKDAIARGKESILKWKKEHPDEKKED